MDIPADSFPGCRIRARIAGKVCEVCILYTVVFIIFLQGEPAVLTLNCLSKAFSIPDGLSYGIVRTYQLIKILQESLLFFIQ